jgi:protein arginine kinase activator
MKCQRCDKQATFHITELTGGKPQELHLCESHAHEYLSESESEQGTPSLVSAFTHQLAVGQTAEELARLDQQSCPVCGVTFYEFRNQGRLGCPHDYVCFLKDLEQLIMNIHGETEHTGKRPRQAAGSSEQHTQLIRLRREMKEAVGGEDYERAGHLRDEIRKIEESH